MTSLDSLPSTPASVDARASRIARRRRLRYVRRGGVVVVILLVGALAGAGYAYTEREPVVEPVAAAPGPTVRGQVPIAAVPESTGRALSVDDPLRLWIGGDSLAGALGVSLGTTAAKTGVVAPRLDSRPSSGLTSPEFFDWPEHATKEMTRLDLEAVVFIIDTNDANMMPRLDDDAVTEDGTNWRVDYRARVNEMMDIFVGDAKRSVYWVSTPPMRDDDLNEKVVALNSVIAEAARTRPEVTYIDITDRFVDAEGDYTSSVTDVDGNRVTLRSSDGVHLTSEGGDRMAAVVFDVLDAYWRILAQTVPGHTQPVVQTEGSSQIPGAGRDNSSSGSSSSGSGSGSGSAVRSASLGRGDLDDDPHHDNGASRQLDVIPVDPVDPVDPHDDRHGSSSRRSPERLASLTRGWGHFRTGR
ncbi:MAG TPA: DUF459 domain-containing protein [Acidimicrobiia bacterium]|nr:DUF459 domain-containing protein [Acidimicrobiia bacterium]